MSTDVLLSLGRHAWARRAASAVGVSLPNTLNRGSQPPWFHAPLLRGLPTALVRVGSAITYSPASLWFESRGLLSLDQTAKASALVVDYTGAAQSDDARCLFSCLREAQSKNYLRTTVVFRSGACAADRAAAAGVAGAIRSLAKELGARGLGVNGVCIHSPAASTSAAPPSVVWHAVQYLSLPEAAFVTGQIVHVGRYSGSGGVQQDAEEAVAEEASEAGADGPSSMRGRVALVTGAARGIGAAIATRLAREGAHVVGVDVPGGRSEDVLRAHMRGLGGSAVPLDIAASGAPASLLAALKAAAVTRTHIVVHNAGITRDKTLRRMTDAQVDAVLRVNLEAPMDLTAALVSGGLIGGEGSGCDRVICISSISGIGGAFGQTNYAYSKAGMIGYVKREAAASVPEGKRSVSYHAVAPGFIETDMVATIPFFTREAGRRLNAFGQGGLPEDVASAVAFFAHPHAGGLSGNVLRVCGGHMLGR